MSELSNKDYKKLSDGLSNKSPIFKNTFFAFLTGGFICSIGEFLSELYKNTGFDEKESSTLVIASLILISAVLTAFNSYDKIAKFGGAGTLVPVTGFANSIVAPAMEFKPEGYILGIGVKIFSIAGPVLTYGGLTSAITGLLYYILQGDFL